MNTKQKGNIGIALAIAYYTSKAYTVCIPLTDSQYFDLIVHKEDLGLIKVQVKYTTQKAPSGNYVVGLRSISGSTREVYKTVKNTDIDELFIATKEHDLYSIPLSKLANSNTITLSKDYLQYRVDIVEYEE